VVIATGRFVEPSWDGPAPERLREVIVQGQRVWTREAAYWKTPNPRGGSSLRSEVYLEAVE
jgi:hypothetical protein